MYNPRIMKKICFISLFLIITQITHSQNLEKFKVYKIEPEKNNGLDISYTVPEIFVESQSNVPTIIKSFTSPLINNSFIITQEIGVTRNNVELKDSSIDFIYNNFDKFIGNVLEKKYNLVSKIKTKVYYTDAIKFRNNIVLKDNTDVYYQDQIVYFLFINKNVVRFIFKGTYDNEETMNKNSDYFEKYVNGQVDKIIIKNSLYKFLQSELKSTRIKENTERNNIDTIK